MRVPSDYLTRNHITGKCIAQFNSEEHADLVVSQ